ncbi:MAG: WbuC family cupin fold metalloprotein [Bacteroidales bacterium]|nr:WbuC family cupin fold metalloprotein [Bacteroidales bacterium]
MIKINAYLLKEMMLKAHQSPRGRINHNFHYGPGDPLQRMLNSMQPGTYLQPHKHENPDKREVFMALTGKFVVIQFNDDGTIADHMILDPKNNEYAAEVASRTYHTIICIEPDSIIYEIKDGPYDPADDKHFALWAPKEGEAGCEDYLKSLLNKLGIPMVRL